MAEASINRALLRGNVVERQWVRKKGFCRDEECCPIPPWTYRWAMASAPPGDRSSPVARAGQRRGPGSPAWLLNRSLCVHGPGLVSVPQFTPLPFPLGCGLYEVGICASALPPARAASSLEVVSHHTRPPFGGCLRLLILLYFLCGYAGLKAGQDSGSPGSISNLVVL